MITQTYIDTIKATAPVLEAGGEALTRHFYQRMFKHNPEVVPLFNPANQDGGVQQQALAAAICAYAANIDNLAAMGGAVELIANKHVSYRIKPEHYPIVGENLLASIKEVLGDGATDAVLEAWGAAYNFLADIFIAREKEIYQTQETATGGWQDFKLFTVERKQVESDVITSFYLKAADGKPAPSFKAGQYITVRVPSPCGHTTMRNYSLSNTSGEQVLRISVKREEGNNSPDGYVSNLLHSSIEEGQQIEIAPPCGDFFLDTETKTDRSLVLLAGGIGITPIISMLQTALKTMPERKITFVHANLNENTHAFKETIDALAAEHENLTIHYRYSEAKPTNIVRMTGPTISEGFVDTALLNSLIEDKNADYYFCGPKLFMIAIYQILKGWNVPADQINLEFFGPLQELEQAA